MEEVHFPCTELRLWVADPAFLRWVGSLRAADDPWVGTVLLTWDSPGSDETGLEREASIYGAGTAARLVDVRPEEDGCHLVLQGQHRFALESVRRGAGWREGWVQPMDEAAIEEDAPDIRRLRQELATVASVLVGELGPRFPIAPEELHRARGLGFETMVNHLAANLDLVAPKKLQLLRLPVPHRAERLLRILKQRRGVLETLRPYRHLASHSRFH